uniref:Uncharacterized protein n=1 Tax=Tanacetum cinerariifolium TaxID=118510 RepID=A0A6L2JCR6_TANCI|nr:hypothetical protein [Tanacetum cinerariifolium]
MIERNFVKIQGTFLIKVRDNAFNGVIGENVFEHINKFLKVVWPIKMNEVSQDRFRLSTFPISLAGATEIEEDNGPNYIADIFKIEGNIFYFNTPFCDAFNDFNYLLKINKDLFTFDIQGTGTYEEYELNNPMTRDLKELCSDVHGFWNGGELPRMVRVGSMTYFQDHKWYDELVDGKLKDETLAFKAKVEGSWGNATPSDDPTLKPSICKIRRFEMMKYSFNVDEEYIAIKESKYLNHSKDSLDAYKELLHIINEEPYDISWGLGYDVLIPVQFCKQEIGICISPTAAVVANLPSTARHDGGSGWKSRRCCCGAGGGGWFHSEADPVGGGVVLLAAAAAMVVTVGGSGCCRGWWGCDGGKAAVEEIVLTGVAAEPLSWWCRLWMAAAVGVSGDGEVAVVVV